MIAPPGRIEKVAEAARGERCSQVWLRGGHLEATDQHVAVRVPAARFENDRDGPIPPLAFRLAREFTSNPDAAIIDASKPSTVAVTGLAGVNRHKPVNPPPTFEELREQFLTKERPHQVAIDVRKLLLVAEALGSDGLMLEFTGDPADPVGVKPVALGIGGGSKEGEAFVMPLLDSMEPPAPPFVEEP